MGEVNPIYLSMLTLLGTMVIVALTALLNNNRLSDLKSLIESNHANMRSSLRWFATSGFIVKRRWLSQPPRDRTRHPPGA